MNNKLTKSQNAVVVAVDRGYRVTKNGDIINPSGKKLNPYLPRGSDVTVDNYSRIKLIIDGTEQQIGIHRICAYSKFGNEMFGEGIVVRHLDGNSTNNKPENIAIGTASDNMMDIMPEIRQRSAQIAGKAASPYTDELWEQVKQDRANGATYKVLTEKYGISKSTLSYQLSKTGKKLSMETRANKKH